MLETKEQLIERQAATIKKLEERIKWLEIHYDDLRIYTNKIIRENNTVDIRLLKAKLFDNQKLNSSLRES